MLHWDPSPIFWTVPGIGLQIAWYGVIFALGFFIGYKLTCKLVERRLGDRQLAIKYTDRLLLLCIAGTVIGARLGHVIFYDWPIYKDNLWAILNIRTGGLASHGAAVGIFLSLLIFQWTSRKPAISFLRLLDIVVIVTALIGGFIRIGNFINQELVGTVTTVPWAVVFGHPVSGLPALPRHAVQLYESAAYFATFFLLWFLYRRTSDRVGLASGLFFTLVFGARFILEAFKEHQSQLIAADSALTMGQWLSIPCVLIGLAMIAWGLRRTAARHHPL